jgi:hypothetical protein
MEELTYRLFMVATVGMLAGTVFLLASSREVKPEHRRGVYISALSKDGCILGKWSIRYWVKIR